MSALVLFAAVCLIIFKTDPEQAGFFGFFSFFTSLFFLLWAIIFIVKDSIMTRVQKKKIVFERVRDSLRHAFLFSLLLVIWIFLNSMDLLRWWNFLLLILMLTTIEFIFISAQKDKEEFSQQND